MSTQGIIQSPAPGNSSALDRYMASMRIQSSNVTMPVSSCHQYFAHQPMDSVAVRSASNSRNRLFSFARTAGLRVVPDKSSCSSSVQKVGKSSSGRNFMYSVRGFNTPTSLVSGQQIVACRSRKVSTAPLVVYRACQSGSSLVYSEACQTLPKSPIASRTSRRWWSDFASSSIF